MWVFQHSLKLYRGMTTLFLNTKVWRFHVNKLIHDSYMSFAIQKGGTSSEIL